MKQGANNVQCKSIKTSFRAWIEIDRAALRHNLHVAKRCAPKAKIMAVVKANAYGHGIEVVVPAISKEVSYFAVASLEEALRLRKVEVKRPVVLLSAALPSEYAAIAQHGFIPTISSYEEACLFAKVAPLQAPIHFKINTGMGRLGMWHEDASKTLEQILALPLFVQSISTHLPAADSDVIYTRTQLALFKKVLPALRAYAPKSMVHILNSAGILRHGTEAQDCVRMGLMLYGVSPISAQQKLLHPVMSWKTQVALITKIPKGSTISYGRTYQAARDLTVAVLPMGYADGYPWQLSGQKNFVLIHGKKVPLLGRVTMDQIMVDISRLKNVHIGDEVVLLGKQGAQEITATALAARAGTIVWHLFTGITERVHRITK